MFISDLENRFRTVFASSSIILTGSLSGSGALYGVGLQVGVDDANYEPPTVIFFANKSTEEIPGTQAHNVSMNIQLQTPGSETATTHIARCRLIESWLKSYAPTSLSYSALADALTSGSIKVYGCIPTDTTQMPQQDKFVYNIEIATYAQPLS